MATGGSIESVALAGRSFPVTADAESNRNLGGYTNEVMPNGDGTARLVKTRTSWAITNLMVQVDDDRGDHEYLKELQDGNEFFPIAVTYVSGAVYQAQGQITGDLEAQSKETKAELSLGGPGALEQQ